MQRQVKSSWKRRNFAYWASSLIDRLHVSEDTILVGTAIIVGLGTGFGAIILQELIDLVGWFGYEWLPSITEGLGDAYVLVVPALGGLFAGPLIYYFAREAKGHGVPEVMEAIAMRGGRIRPIVALIKSLASSFTIGSGGSAGREGPIVQIGSAFGSTIGQSLHLSDDRIRNLVACGAASGIAALFNAPIAGVIFALEVILDEFSVRYFSTVVISAVAASVVGRAAFGAAPIFVLPVEYGIKNLWEFMFYPLLGVLGAVVGFAFVRMLYWTEDLFDDWKRPPEWLKPAIGGLLLGVMALLYPVLTGIGWTGAPQIFNNAGHEVISGALANELTLGVVLLLLVLKLAATCFTLGSGGSGGIFAPSLFMGAMLGTAFEITVNTIFPDIPAPPGAYALVGMAAVFAASAHAPITALIIAFELTDDSRIILPMMLTVVVATLLSRILLHKESIYTLKLSRRGVRLQRGRDVDVLQGVMVSEVMTHDLHSVSANSTLNELMVSFNQTHSHGYPVLDSEGYLTGLVTISDLDHALANQVSRETPVCDICTPYAKLLTAFPDEPIGAVLARLGARGLGRMPVVERERPSFLVGMIRRADIVRAYDLALARRTAIQHQQNHLQANSPEGTEFVEVTLGQNSPAVGLAVQQLADQLPDECILISITRDNKVLIPHGNTIFKSGDHITAFSRSLDTSRLIHCLNG
ncbi:MAG: chloride channel protein [Anaerolineaceae bacterium]|nr:chloride channel protein [Anaerolineaceae bacterium]